MSHQAPPRRQAGALLHAPPAPPPGTECCPKPAAPTAAHPPAPPSSHRTTTTGWSACRRRRTPSPGPTSRTRRLAGARGPGRAGPGGCRARCRARARQSAPTCSLQTQEWQLLPAAHHSAARCTPPLSPCPRSPTGGTATAPFSRRCSASHPTMRRRAASEPCALPGVSGLHAARRERAALASGRRPVLTARPAGSCRPCPPLQHHRRCTLKAPHRCSATQVCQSHEDHQRLAHLL